MKSLNKFAVVGLTILTLATGVGCGKKKSGSAAVATPPATSGGTDCSGNNCNVGQSYASGIFLTYAVGHNNYGSNKQIIAKVALYGTEKDGYDKDYNQNGIAYYNGDVTMNGSIEVKSGSMYSSILAPMAERQISSFSFNIDWNIFGNSGNSNNYNNDYYYNPGYNTGYNPGYNDGYANCGNSCGTCNSGCGNNGGNNNSNSCQLPTGKYTIKTVQKGTWYGDYAAFENVEITLSGGKKAEGVFTQAYVTAGYNDDDNTLSGQLILTKIDGKSCNTQVIF